MTGHKIGKGARVRLDYMGGDYIEAQRRGSPGQTSPGWGKAICCKCKERKPIKGSSMYMRQGLRQVTCADCKSKA